MAQQSIPLLTLTITAAEELTVHRFVGHDGETATAGGNTLGVARSDAADGENVAVDVMGTTVVEAGGKIDAGKEIKSDASGRAVDKGSSGDTVGRLAPGASAAAAGDLVEIILIAN